MNEVDDALELLLGPEGLGNFHFVSDSDRGTALALMLLRPMWSQGVRFDDGTPLHWIEAPTQGAGKTSLARLCTGERGVPYPRPELARERIIQRAALAPSDVVTAASGSGVVFFDNVSETVQSTVLASRMTSGVLVHTWVMTVQPGVGASEDFLGPRGRAVRIRLTGEAPDGRLPKALSGGPEAQDARSALDKACIVLLDAWTAAGRPELEEPFVTRWRRWEAQMGGLLHMHSLSTVRDSRAITEPSVTNDPVVTTLRALYGTGSASTKELHCNPQFAWVVKPLMHDWTVRALSQRLSRLAIAGFLVREPGREARWRVSEPS